MFVKGGHSGVVIEGISIRNCHDATNGGAIFISGTPNRYKSLDTSIYFDDDEDKVFVQGEADEIMDDKTKATVDWIKNSIDEWGNGLAIDHVTIRNVYITNCSAVVGGGIASTRARVVIQV